MFYLFIIGTLLIAYWYTLKLAKKKKPKNITKKTEIERN